MEADVFDLLCYLIACVLFALVTLNVSARWNLLALGLFFAVLPHLVGAFMDAGAGV
jgi:hypothetical protein